MVAVSLITYYLILKLPTIVSDMIVYQI